MLKWLMQKFLSDPETKAKALKWLRWASQGAGAWVLTSLYVWLRAHLAMISDGDAAAIAGVVSTAVAGLILSGGSAIYSMIDVANVGAKVAIAKAGGTDAQINDKAVVAQVKTVLKAEDGTPQAIQQVQTILAAGQE